jgi:hypothetical protein
MTPEELAKIHFQLPTELKTWAEVQASIEQTSLASIIRKALYIYLQENGQDSIDVLKGQTFYSPLKDH